MEVHDRADGVRVVNDTYNANPASMRAAVDTLAELWRPAAGRTGWAVLGDMLELGPDAAALHAGPGRPTSAGRASTRSSRWGSSPTAGRRHGGAGPIGARAEVASDRDDAVRRVLTDLRPATWSWSRRRVA